MLAASIEAELSKFKWQKNNNKYVGTVARGCTKSFSPATSSFVADILRLAACLLGHPDNLQLGNQSVSCKPALCCLRGYSIIGYGSGFTMNSNPK